MRAQFQQLSFGEGNCAALPKQDWKVRRTSYAQKRVQEFAKH